MDINLKTQFLERWEKYFGHAELPFVFYYTDGDGGAPMAVPAKGRSCIICELAKVRKGKSLFYDSENTACGGAKRYLGFTDKVQSFGWKLELPKPGQKLVQPLPLFIKLDDKVAEEENQRLLEGKG